MSHIVYYKKSNGQFCVYEGAGIYKTVAKLERNINKFELSPGFVVDDNETKKSFNADQRFDNGLMSFDLKLCDDRNNMINNECKMTKKYDIFTSKKGYYKTSNNITLDFFRKCVRYDRYKNFQPITFEESMLQDLTYNSGILYGNIGTHDNVHSYDYTMFYPSLLCDKDFKIPVSEGSYIEFNDVSYDDIKTLAFGYYHCHIEINNDLVNKVFMQKRDDSQNYTNWHTHYDLILALKLQKCHEGINIRPLGKAYVYTDLVSGVSIFNDWYQQLVKMKKDLPGNIIVKKLSSSLWGYLTQSNKFNCQEDEAEKKYELTTQLDESNKHYIINYHVVDNGKSYYELLDLNKPLQKYNFRLKSFITAFGRYKMTMCLYRDLDKVQRIVTDGFMITGEFYNFNKHKTLKYESDKCGHHR